MSKVDLTNPPNEYPDIVGVKPTNPILAAFRPYISAATKMRELTPARADRRDAARDDLRRFVALSRPESRTDGQRVDSGRGHLDHTLPAFLQVRRAGRDHPREQHRANRRLGRRIDRLRPRRHHARDHDPGVRSRDHARDAGRDARRTARHSDDDPAAPRAHRRATRHPEISRRHGLRRGLESSRRSG